MKAKTANPNTILVVPEAFTHLAALRPIGERSTTKATICIQANGKEKVVLFTEKLIKIIVSGCNKKANSKTAFNPTVGAHLRFMSSPKATAFSVAGRKSRPINVTGFPKSIAKKDPKIILRPPVYGPNIIPYSGAMMSESENDPAIPIIGTVGIILNTIYSAEKTAIYPTSLVLTALLLMSFKFFAPTT